MRLLVTADIHIGCRPTEVPAQTAANCSPAVMLREDVVKAAVDREVDAVLLAGDVVDQQNKYFEAVGVLEQVVEKLSRENIVTFAVAGNHDHDVLSSIAANAPTGSLKVLGTGGQWESCSLSGRDGGNLKIWGWSFPGEHVEESPLESFPGGTAADDASCVIGLLHADLDGNERSYAPVQGRELADTGVPLWILGHLHKPSRRNIDHTCILYPGSPQGLDPGPGERGPHGPWLLELDDSEFSMEQLPLARIRYEEVAVVLDNVQTAEKLREEVSRTLRDRINDWKSEMPALAFVSVRLLIEGSTTLSQEEVRGVIGEISESGAMVLEGVEVFVNQLQVAAYPPIDFEALRHEQTPPSVLVNILDELEADEPFSAEVEALVTNLQSRLYSDVYQAGAFFQLPDAGSPEDLGREDVIIRLRNQARALLTALWKQRASQQEAEKKQ